MDKKQALRKLEKITEMGTKLELTTKMETKTTKVEIKDQYKSIDEYLEVMYDYFNLVIKMRMNIAVYILKEDGCNELLFFDNKSIMTVIDLEEEILWQYNYVKENPNG